ncbi:MAG: hypothetical protein Q8K65_05990 [Alphaproteobacteria bacterium]|nr:hypothetical protein [Alphaproteobacteria bacterium]
MKLESLGKEFSGTPDHARGMAAIQERYSNGNKFMNALGHAPAAAKYDAPSNGQ